ncbi:MAG TPA: hypothetical protein VGQ26_27270 [Streptosporangiaceae bacterium]|jgi:hypothetical protein|nr:hypothetical protein [Streptosporangiaceae bacterium]
MTSDTIPEDEFRAYCERLTEAQLEELIVSKLAPRMNAAREAALAEDDKTGIPGLGYEWADALAWRDAAIIAREVQAAKRELRFEVEGSAMQSRPLTPEELTPEELREEGEE